ncbi:hypothetical protein K466DRAFT_12305 [Polyporus arcularius HHB13444]|uniref:Uncharacterized protein n=1 Tax=Polyporus arcularius HHB13444 TaxID=1314778 RepID=A0A5C3NQA0_9APHY|nr:hypothetical protein K466DRAFT_12305 [Polyporus arcularius HHB13444]
MYTDSRIPRIYSVAVGLLLRPALMCVRSLHSMPSHTIVHTCRKTLHRGRTASHIRLASTRYRDYVHAAHRPPRTILPRLLLVRPPATRSSHPHIIHSTYIPPAAINHSPLTAAFSTLSAPPWDLVLLSASAHALALVLYLRLQSARPTPRKRTPARTYQPRACPRAQVHRTPESALNPTRRITILRPLTSPGPGRTSTARLSTAQESRADDELDGEDSCQRLPRRRDKTRRDKTGRAEEEGRRASQSWREVRESSHVGQQKLERRTSGAPAPVGSMAATRHAASAVARLPSRNWHLQATHRLARS